MSDNHSAIEMMKKMQPHGLDTQGLAMAEAQHEWMFLIITCLIIKIFLGCGFMGAAVMLEKRVDHANWIAGVICFAAVVYNLIDFGVQCMMLPDSSNHRMAGKEADTVVAGIPICFSVLFLIKMAIYVGLIVFLNNKTNTAIFTPRTR